MNKLPANLSTIVDVETAPGTAQAHFPIDSGILTNLSIYPLSSPNQDNISLGTIWVVNTEGTAAVPRGYIVTASFWYNDPLTWNGTFAFTFGDQLYIAVAADAITSFQINANVVPYELLKAV